MSVGVSMTPELKKALLTRAVQLGISPSNYIQQLIRKDLGLPTVGVAPLAEKMVPAKKNSA